MTNNCPPKRQYIKDVLIKDESNSVLNAMSNTEIRGADSFTTFSDEIIDTAYTMIEQGASPTIMDLLTHCFVTERQERLQVLHRYSSLIAEGMPELHTQWLFWEIVKVPERYGFKVSGSIALTQRIGMAHALFALYVSFRENDLQYVPRELHESAPEDDTYAYMRDHY